jgi:hypothetical protein
MGWLFLIIFFVILCFGFVVCFGPPYVPTLTEQVNVALDLVDLKKGDTLLELGSGDGKVLLAAARRGWKAVGFELNPLLVIYSRIRLWKYRKHVKIIWGNYWQTRKWPPADGIFTFMIGRQMPRLHRTIEVWHQKPVRLASFAFAIPTLQPTTFRRGVYLYEYD